MTPLGLRMMRHVRCRALFLLASPFGCGTDRSIQAMPPPGSHVGYYVTPGGSASSSGGASSPWDLATALSGGGGRVQPGDTIWLGAGTYQGAFTSTLTGSAGSPIVVRQYPGERAT